MPPTPWNRPLPITNPMWHTSFVTSIITRKNSNIGRLFHPVYRTGLPSVVKMTAPNSTAVYLRSLCPNPLVGSDFLKSIHPALATYFSIIFTFLYGQRMTRKPCQLRTRFLVQLLDHGSQQWSKLQSSRDAKSRSSATRKLNECFLKKAKRKRI